MTSHFSHVTMIPPIALVTFSRGKAYPFPSPMDQKVPNAFFESGTWCWST